MPGNIVFRVGWRYLIRHPWQSGLLVLGILLGVAVMVAIDLANASASRAFDLSTDAISGRATHQIVSGSIGFDENLYIRLLRSENPPQMTPVVVEYVSSPQLGNRPFTLLGIDPFSEGPFRNYFGEQNEVPISLLAAMLARPGSVYLSVQVAERYGLVPCEDIFSNQDPAPDRCQITLDINGAQQTAYIAGLLQPVDTLTQQALDAVVLTDLSTAQEFTGKLGVLDRIDLILPETNPNNTDLTRELNDMLPENVDLQEVAARSGTVQEMTAAFRVNLTALSLLALLVGLFLIYNTITFSIVQRRPYFGTLRCLGVTRQEIFVLVMGEALLMGLLGSILGILAGVLLGQGAVGLVTQTINDLFFVVSIRGIQIPVESLIKGGLVGIVATLITAAPPAWEAASVPPRTALYRSGLEDKARKAVNGAAYAGGGLILLGSLILLLIPTNNLVVSFGGTFAVIVGFAMLTPLITKTVTIGAIPVLGKIWGVLGRLAPRDLVNSISRTAIAIAALMVAVSVTIGVSLMINSFRYTVETWLSQTLQGDIYISSPGQTSTQPGGVINREVVSIVAQTAGVADLASLRAVSVESNLGSVNLTAIDHPIRDPGLFLTPGISPDEIWAKMQEGAIIVSEPFANRFGIPRTGGEIELLTKRGMRNFPVVAVFSDYASTQGTIRMTLDAYRSYWDDPQISALALFIEPGVDAAETTRFLQDTLAPIQRLFVRSNLELRNEALAVFDRTFAITNAMRLLATLVAFIGILSALLALLLEKQRQMGILRAVGLTNRQLWGYVLLQTGLMGSVAGLLAMPAGYILSLILVYIINLRSFGWTLQMQVTPEPFISAYLIALVAALLAGLYPAYKITSLSTAEAIRGE